MKFLICLALVSVASAYYTGGTKGGARVESVDESALLGLTRSRGGGGGASAGASYGGGASGGASYGGASQASSASAGASFSSSASEWAAGGASSHQVSGPINAAVVTRYNVQYVDVPTQRQAPQVQEILIPASNLPLAFTFESASSPVQVSQKHTPAQPSEPQSEEFSEPDQILRSTISKNLVHEITESIQPVRRITQEVKPVLEEVNQLIARGQEVQGVAQATSQVSSQGSYAQEATQDESALLGASRAQQVQQELIERRRAKKRAAILAAIRRARA